MVLSVLMSPGCVFAVPHKRVAGEVCLRSCYTLHLLLNRDKFGAVNQCGGHAGDSPLVCGQLMSYTYCLPLKLYGLFQFYGIRSLHAADWEAGPMQWLSMGICLSINGYNLIEDINDYIYNLMEDILPHTCTVCMRVCHHHHQLRE